MSPLPDSDGDDDDSGVLVESHITVSTGIIDYYIFAATTIALPPFPTTISNDYQVITVYNPSVVAIEGGTLTAGGPAATLSPSKPAPHDDWLPQSASYAPGMLVLGVKTSTDTYPPQILTPESGNSGLASTPPTLTFATPAADSASLNFPNHGMVTATQSPSFFNPVSEPGTFADIATGASGASAYATSLHGSGNKTIAGLPLSTSIMQPFSGAPAGSTGVAPGPGSLLGLLVAGVLGARLMAWR